LEGIPLQQLATGFKELSAKYRAGKKGPGTYMEQEMHRKAYLAFRLPATYAVVSRILQELSRFHPELQIMSLADLGAGPGTASWAAAQWFPALAHVSLYEQDTAMVRLGKRLMHDSASLALRNAKWIEQNLSQTDKFDKNDLFVFCYSIGEIAETTQEKLLEQTWEATSQALVLIEPGTPAGFARLRRLREQLIQQGAYIAAPCPHQEACPLAGSDWCHFAERLGRSRLHKQVKEASLGYEDEKYSYVVALKTAPKTSPIGKRVLRHPKVHSGHIELTLCTAEGIQKETLSRRNGALYKQARKLEWGDLYF
jgi:ribosomal protein RSM22 (predicted rRNA methylase)